MQEQLRNSLGNCRGPNGSLLLSVQESTKPVDLVWMNRFPIPQMPLTGFNRLARCNRIMVPGARALDAREEAM